MRKTAKFPGVIWDGSSDSRPATGESGEAAIDVHREPDGDDYAQIQAEVLALESAVTDNTTNLTRERLLSGAANVAAVALAATSGHGKIPNCAGTPTGVPGDVPTGFSAILYDTTAHKLWIYDGAWKATAALA